MTWSADWPERTTVRFHGGRLRWRSHAARDDELCPQCNFPWFMHPERYDSEEKATLRFCSEYPSDPVRSVEDCIVP